MGKNSAIRSLSKCIGNIVMHKILAIYTNKPESKNHLETEIIEYSSNSLEKSQEYSWSEEDILIIKEKAIKRIENLSKNYPDVKYKKDDISRLLKETMEELMLR